MQSLYHCMLYDITTSCMKVIILFEIDLNIRDRNSQNNNKGRRNSNCNVSFWVTLTGISLLGVFSK